MYVYCSIIQCCVHVCMHVGVHVYMYCCVGHCWKAVFLYWSSLPLSKKKEKNVYCLWEYVNQLKLIMGFGFVAHGRISREISEFCNYYSENASKMVREMSLGTWKITYYMDSLVDYGSIDLWTPQNPRYLGFLNLWWTACEFVYYSVSKELLER